MKEVQKFIQEYIESHLPYLVHDGLDDLVPNFRDQIPILNQNTQTIISILSQQPNYNLTTKLVSVALNGAPLKAKDKSVRGQINRLLK